MRLDETIQQHVSQLPLHLQNEVYDFVLFLEQKQTTQTSDADAIEIHKQLLEQYSEAFEKLAQ
jgi:Protein of unknown function (DUF2281)